MSERQPIKIIRISPTLFEIHCNNEMRGDITESLLKRLCQFPADFEKEEKIEPVDGIAIKEEAKSQPEKKEIPFYVYNQDVPFDVRFGLMKTLIGLIPLGGFTAEKIIETYKKLIKILTDNSTFHPEDFQEKK